ncbi:MAG: hypothetical protein GX096_05965 [Clostridiales bacterium]|nr:hypothetical protein [Clostridiales bacterium]
MKDYKIDYMTNTIIVTKKFITDAGVIGSSAFEQMKTLRSMGMPIQQRPSKERKSRNVTLAQMIRYIACVEHSELYMARFEAVKAEAKSKSNYYHRVCKWFHTTFPNFYDMPEFNANNEIIITPIDYPIDEIVTINAA